MGLFDRLRGNAKGTASSTGKELTPDQAAELLAAIKDVEEADRRLLAANLELRDHGMRAVARSRHETFLVDRPQRTDACFGLVTLAEDGQTLFVYEGEIVNADGTIELVGAGDVTVPGVAVLERGSTGYFNHLWRADAELQAVLAERPEILAGLRDGTIALRYVMVDSHAGGRITTTDYTLARERLQLGL